MDGEWFRWIVSGLGGVIVIVFGAMIKRLFSKQDELAREKANRDSTDKRFDEMLSMIRAHMAEDRDMHKEVGRKLDETNRHLSMTNATLANLAGRFDGHFSNGNS